MSQNLSRTWNLVRVATKKRSHSARKKADDNGPLARLAPIGNYTEDFRQSSRRTELEIDLGRPKQDWRNVFSRLEMNGFQNDCRRKHNDIGSNASMRRGIVIGELSMIVASPGEVPGEPNSYDSDKDT